MRAEKRIEQQKTTIYVKPGDPQKPNKRQINRGSSDIRSAAEYTVPAYKTKFLKKPQAKNVHFFRIIIKNLQ